MKRVLVTGANGFVGQHMITELINHGYEVVALSGTTGVLGSTVDSVTNITIDLMDPAAVNTIDFTNIHGVVHLAGLAAVGPSFDSPNLYMQSNIGMEINLFEAALQQNHKPKFLIISSGSLYDPTALLPLTEKSTVIPNSPYAVSKLGQEQMAKYYAGRGFEVAIARPFNHIGPGQNLGFIVPDITSQAVACTLNVATPIIVGNLDAKRDYTDVRDIVAAYRLLLEHSRTTYLYNVCSGISRSGHDILAQILHTLGIDPSITHDPARMRPADAPDIYGTSVLLSQETGWKPSFTFEQTIQDVVADWQNRLT